MCCCSNKDVGVHAGRAWCKLLLHLDVFLADIDYPCAKSEQLYRFSTYDATYHQAPSARPLHIHQHSHCISMPSTFQLMSSPNMEPFGHLSQSGVIQGGISSSDKKREFFVPPFCHWTIWPTLDLFVGCWPPFGHWVIWPTLDLFVGSTRRQCALFGNL